MRFSIDFSKNTVVRPIFQLLMNNVVHNTDKTQNKIRYLVIVRLKI